MKKVSTLIIAMGLALSLTACGGTSSENATPENNTPTESVEETNIQESSSETSSSENEPAPSEEPTYAAKPEMENEEAKPEMENEEEEAETPYYFKDLELVSKDYSIKITDWKVIPAGEEGNSYGDSPVLAFWYDTTNTSGESINPSTAWIFAMNAVQDNDPNAINKLNMASHPDSSLLDYQMAEIKEGGTIANAVAYTLTDTVTPVELTASSGLAGDSLGTMTFDIVTGEVTNGGSVTIGTAETTEDVEPSFEDNIIITKDFTIEILEYKIIPAGEEGNKYNDSPVIAFWYNTTNTSGKEINPSTAWIFTVTAIQDNDPNMVNKLNIASLPDSRFLDSQTAMIKAGGTVENAVAYTLSDLDTPVELIAKDGLLGDELGSNVFEIN